MTSILFCFLSAIAADPGVTVSIAPGSRADDVEARYVTLLADRFAEFEGIELTKAAEEADVLCYLGTAESHDGLAQVAAQLGVTMPTTWDPGKEGFVLATGNVRNQRIVLAAGTDRRGVLYAIGELLRRIEVGDSGITIPAGLHLRRAPRWPVRGLIVSQGHTMRELTGARAWTPEELQRAYIEFALAGSNTFELGSGDRGMFDYLKSMGLDALTVVNGNAGSGPPEWCAKEAIGRTGFLSPVIPEARAELLRERENLFRNMPAFDYVHIKSGDGGGDESEAAAPYGKTLAYLSEEYAQLLHQYHPNTRVFIGNQKLDNAGDRAILEYFQTHPNTLLDGIVYGPGSNAMGWTPGRRQDHRLDLFEYAGRGAMGGYLRELLHQLPPRKSILLFTDITHWVYSQYGLMDHELIADRDYATPPRWDSAMYEHSPDPAMAMVYDRRTFFARPRNYYRAFQETMAFAIGDVAYSEGHHDHVNQWIYQRLFWDPHQSVEDVVAEYARAHFGHAAAASMASAIFQFEENLQTPIANNDGVDRLLDLLRRAGREMPESIREKNYLWRQYLQKACLDKYIQLDVRQQQAFIDQRIAAIDSANSTKRLQHALASVANSELPDPTRRMMRLNAEAATLGDESERLYGVRNVGLFNLEQDYHGFGWLKREAQRGADAANESEACIHAARIAAYDDPGPGGFYDNAGVPAESPHLIYGWPYGDGGFNNANRPSQRTMAFTTDEECGVAFRYAGLDRDADYRVRFTLVRPRYLERYADKQHQTGQTIYADDTALAENLELPEYDADFFEYDIPRNETADGELVLWMKKQPGVGEGLASDVSIWRNTGGWGTLVSEVWLMKR